jgi:NADPH:quinone reductase-like Zn-dependent oxidoreductase
LLLLMSWLPFQVLLVLGAAGGVGVSAVQIGKVCGAVVIAVARYLIQGLDNYTAARTLM